MFDIGFFELLLIAILGLLILGPERLPQAVRTVGLWVGRIKRMASSIQQEVNDQLQLEEMRQRLAEHEKRVKDGLIRTEEEAKASLKGEPLPDRSPDKAETSSPNSESPATESDALASSDDSHANLVNHQSASDGAVGNGTAGNETAGNESADRLNQQQSHSEMSPAERSESTSETGKSSR